MSKRRKRMSPDWRPSKGLAHPPLAGKKHIEEALCKV